MAEGESGAQTFDRVSGRYHALLDESLSATGESSEYFARGRIGWLARRLGRLGARPRRILDFGCGTGSAAPFLCETFDPDALLGIDVSPASIEIARSTHGSARTRFLPVADHLPAAEADLAYCNGVFHHIPPAERPGALGIVFDSLGPGGYFAFWENNPWNVGTRWVMSHCEFDRDAVPVSPLEARRLLRSAGFEVLRTDFLFIFPNALRALRGLEPLVSRLPLGGQYQVLARKP